MKLHPAGSWADVPRVDIIDHSQCCTWEVRTASGDHQSAHRRSDYRRKDCARDLRHPGQAMRDALTLPRNTVEENVQHLHPFLRLKQEAMQVRGTEVNDRSLAHAVTTVIDIRRHCDPTSQPQC